MNHDFDNEFETDDELKRETQPQKRREGSLLPSGHTARTGSTGTRRGSRTAQTAGNSRLRAIIIFYCGRDHCAGTDRRRLVWKAYDVSDADRYRV